MMAIDSAIAGHQHDRVDVVRDPRPGIASAKPRTARFMPARREELRLRRAQQRDGEHPAPSGAEEIGRPGTAEIPDGPAEDRRGRRPEPGEEREPAEISGVALGELGDQGLRA